MHTICHFYINFAEKKNPDFEDSRWFKVIAEGSHAYFKLIDIFVAELFIPRHEICRLILCVKIDKWCLRVIDIFIQRLNNVQAKRTLKKFWEECNEQAQIYCNSTMHCWLFAVVVFIFIFLHVCNDKTQRTSMSIQSLLCKESDRVGNFLQKEQNGMNW